MFGGCAYVTVSEVVYVEVSECCVNIVGEVVPICSVVISVSTFSGGVGGGGKVCV